MAGWDYKGNMPKLSEEYKDQYIVNIQGREYVTVNGLIALAHEKGLKSMETELVQFPNKDNDMTAIFKATVIGYGWDPVEGRATEVKYTSYADASTKSVSNAKIAIHFIRMAETRAIGRVLRNYTNIAMTALEELGTVMEVPKVTAVQVNQIKALMKSTNIDAPTLKDKLIEICGKESLKDATPDEADELIAYLKAM